MRHKGIMIAKFDSFLELHDTKTYFSYKALCLMFYSFLELHDTKTSNSCDFVSI